MEASAYTQKLQSTVHRFHRISDLKKILLSFRMFCFYKKITIQTPRNNVLSVLIPLSKSLPIHSDLNIVHYLKNSPILKTETSFFFLHFYHIILVLELWSNSSVRKPRKHQTEPGAHFTVLSRSGPEAICLASIDQRH